MEVEALAESSADDQVRGCGIKKELSDDPYFGDLSGQIDVFSDVSAKAN